MFVLNIRTEYKYYIVLTITKIIFGVGVPPFLLIFVDYPIPLMMVNTILFMVATALPNISRLLKHMEPRTIAPAYMNPYTYSHFNRPGMHRPPNVAYMQPQQPYYAMPPNMKNNIPELNRIIHMDRMFHSIILHQFNNNNIFNKNGMLLIMKIVMHLCLLLMRFKEEKVLIRLINRIKLMELNICML